MTEAATQCKRCEVEILERTATRTGGLCVPCKENRKQPSRTPTPDRQPGRSVDWMCIGITLDSKTKTHADYAFESMAWDKDPRFRSRSMIVGTTRGLMRLDRETGDITLLSPMPEDQGDTRFQRAARVVRRHWEAGELPEATQFACG